jgi:hypothetical protein
MNQTKPIAITATLTLMDRRAGFGLTRFHGRFDNDAVLFLHHHRHLNFWREVGTVKHRDLFKVVRQGTRWRVFRSMAQHFGACIQSIGSFVCAATGVVTTGWHLVARIGFCGRYL